MFKSIEYKSLVCLNGELPDNIFFGTLPKVPIVALDGAGRLLKEMGIKYDLIIGDFDSVDPHHLEDVEAIHTPDQSMSDFQKAIPYLKERNLLPSLILGMSGGSLDHILHNINVFVDLKCSFYAPPVFGRMVSGEREFTMPLYSKVSFFGIPEAVVSTEGLYWDMKDQILRFPGFNSCFNRSVKPQVRIKVHSGSVLLLAYTQPVIDGWQG